MSFCLHKAPDEELYRATELLTIISTKEKVYEFRRCYSCKALILFIDNDVILDIDLNDIVTLY